MRYAAYAPVVLLIVVLPFALAPLAVALSPASVPPQAVAALLMGPITDCNSNGVDDATDISNGTSRDCNSNGTPDSCEKKTCGNTEFLNPTTIVDEADAVATWSNSNYVATPDGQCAATTLTANNGCRTLTLTGFNANIPTSAISPGIRLQIAMYAYTLGSSANWVNSNAGAYGLNFNPPSGSGNNGGGNAFVLGTASPALFSTGTCASNIKSIITDEVHGDFGQKDGNGILQYGTLTTGECNSSGAALHIDFGCSANDTFYIDAAQLKFKWDERDCNTNNVPDVCETGYRDCNTNNTMDLCEWRDCNTNCTNDATETSIDINSNGIPDPCDSVFLNTSAAFQRQNRRPSANRPGSR